MALQCKQEMSHDALIELTENVPMDSPSEYRDAFIARVKLAREEAGYNQTEMARLLSMKGQGHYKQFEKRSILPHRYIEQFCLSCKVNELWLLTGQGPMRRRQAPEVEKSKDKPSTASQDKWPLTGGAKCPN